MENFYREYNPPLTKNANTCVGLGLLLIGKLSLLDSKFPGIKDSLYLVSCEESIEVIFFYSNVYLLFLIKNYHYRVMTMRNTLVMTTQIPGLVIKNMLWLLCKLKLMDVEV